METFRTFDVREFGRLKFPEFDGVKFWEIDGSEFPRFDPVKFEKFDGAKPEDADVVALILGIAVAPPPCTFPARRF